MTADLPVDRVVTIDTEFTPVVGGRLIPVCLVAHELISGARIRLWENELGTEPPFPTDDRTLYVAYMAAAEIGFFLTCGWPVPVRVLDLYVEYKNLVNLALPKSYGRREPAGLHDAMRYFGTLGIETAHKKAMQARVIAGGPFTEQEKADIIDYCESDVLPLAPLMERMLLHIRAKRKAPWAPRRGLGQALYRGRYMTAVAAMEYTGVPIDVPTYQQVKTHRVEVMEYLIEQGDRAYGVFNGTTFQEGLFRKYLAEQGLLDTWPRTGKRGYLSTDQDVVKEQARAHPQLETLRQLFLLHRTMKDFPLAVGPDGRNRTSLWAFDTATGRNRMATWRSARPVTHRASCRLPG